MNRVIQAAVVAVVLGGLHVHETRGQDDVLAEMYGQGVHAYFAGDYFKAHELLNNAIKHGCRDPRCYLFRGLTYSVLGRPDESEADFKQGSELEMTSQDRAYPVSDSLQRIQGPIRLQIEKYRQMARLESRSRSNQVEKARYDEMNRVEQNVLRDPSRMKSARPSTPPVEAPAAADPFADANQVKPEKAAPRKSPVVGTPATADPFGAGTPAAKPAAEADPFAAPAGAKPAADDPFGTAPAAKPSAKPAMDDPFGAAAPPAPAPAARPAADDPFGTAPAAPPPASKPAADDPFGAAPAAPAAKPAADDPFGTAPAAPTPPAKSEAASDPFGDDKPAAKPPAPAGDPFGN
jgi:hypothetical protein